MALTLSAATGAGRGGWRDTRGLEDFVDMAGDGKGDEDDVTVEDEEETIAHVRHLLYMALALQPDHMNSMLLLGQLTQTWDRDVDAAENMYKAAFACDPQHGGALSLVAMARLARAMPVDTVLRRRSMGTTSTMLQHAVRLSPSAPGPALVHGVYLLHMQRQPSAARDLLRRAAELSPSDEHVLRHYAVCLWQLQRIGESQKVFLQIRELRLVRDWKMSVGSARDDIAALLAHLKATDPKIARSLQIVQMIKDQLDGQSLAALDKRLLTDAEWSTTIGRQGGTMFNITQLQNFGRLPALTPQEDEHFKRYMTRKRPQLQLLDPDLKERTITQPLALTASDLTLLPSLALPLLAPPSSSTALSIGNASVGGEITLGEEEREGGMGGDEKRSGVGEYEELVGETALVEGDANAVAAAVARRMEMLQKGERGEMGQGVQGVSERYVEPVGGAAKEALEKERSRLREKKVERDEEEDKQFDEVMRMLEGRRAAQLASRTHTAAHPAEQLLRACDETLGYMVRIEGLHDDVDNDMLFTFLETFHMPAIEVDVPFDPRTGEAFGEGVATFSQQVQAMQAIQTLNHKSPPTITRPGERLRVELINV